MSITPAPPELFAQDKRVMFVFAHQDDELPYVGLIHRAPFQSRFLWVTNGDGLAEGSGLSPGDYADARRLETTMAMGCIGVSKDQMRFLDHSEVAIYRNFTKVADPSASQHEVRGFFRNIGAQVTAEIKAFGPDIVYTLAWQGGHPEHDLVHLATRAALRGNRETLLFELPEYELANTVLLRFPPWRRSSVHQIQLSARELKLKHRVFNCYPTQARGLHQIRTALRIMGFLAAPGIGSDGFDRYVSREVFGSVPRDRDYGFSPHRVEALEYVGDDFEGIPIRYDTMIAPLADAL